MRLIRENIISEVSFMKTQQTFEEHLRKGNLSENTISSYLWTVNYYHTHYDELSKENLLAYKGYLYLSYHSVRGNSLPSTDKK